MENPFSNFEFDPQSAGISFALSMIFIVMIWKIPIWNSYPLFNKITITVLLPIISYFIVKWRLDQGD
jgi:uncharacterized membrane protein YqjE